MSSESKVLLIFGEGGHSQQMSRLCQHISVDKKDVISLVDKENISSSISSTEYVVPKLRSKYSVGFSTTLKNTIRNMTEFLRVFNDHNVKIVISTGPGICIIPSIFYKLKGREVIYIETWCRFSTKSLTGKVMYYVADKFYVQNRELLTLYPKAIYSGRL
ncbi:PssD/Cps14F family polysaccharide biosynthesis glycosyltransferase [Vibrio alginolyticus]|uniref:PssD/Cps14F family polysaccharide biosynthesis glycosyltransferase n=1 Tax=Vibrio alginolyticus TaxID=663 RepID=UPI00375528E7